MIAPQSPMDSLTPPLGDDSEPIDFNDPAQLLAYERRSALKALLGLAAGGVISHAAYPWLAGDKQDELAAGVKSFMRRLEERLQSGRSSRTARTDCPTRNVPIQLDATGREYETFLTGLQLRHIKPIEVLRPHFKIRGTVSNGLPPRELWPHAAATLRVADELRERLGVRLLTIASAYRSPEYNAMCPGAAAHSYHLRNMALDLVFECSPAKVAEAAEALRATGFFTGGIGRYPGFTHIDTRGKAADWG